MPTHPIIIIQYNVGGLVDHAHWWLSVMIGNNKKTMLTHDMNRLWCIFWKVAGF